MLHSTEKIQNIRELKLISFLITRLSHFLRSELQASARSRHWPAEPAIPSHAWGEEENKGRI
jgi:hypothetical protein